MKNFILLCISLLFSVVPVYGQSVTGQFMENSPHLGHYGKLKYDESVTIKQWVDVGNLTNLTRRVTYFHQNDGDIVQFDETDSTSVNHLFEYNFMNLDWQRLWTISIQYLDEEGDPVPALSRTFTDIATIRPVELTIAPIPTSVDEPYIMFVANVFTSESDPTLQTNVVLDVYNPDYGWTDVDVYEVDDAGWFYQAVYMHENLLFPGCHEVEIRVERYDLDYPMDFDYQPVVVDVAPAWPCTYWAGNSTGLGHGDEAFELSAPFPNPTEGIMTIKDIDSTLGLDVCDALGRTVRNFPSNGQKTATLDVSDLSAGMYFLRQGNRKVRFEKL